MNEVYLYKYFKLTNFCKVFFKVTLFKKQLNITKWNSIFRIFLNFIMYPPCAFELSLLLLTIIHKIFGKIISKKTRKQYGDDFKYDLKHTVWQMNLECNPNITSKIHKNIFI